MVVPDCSFFQERATSGLSNKEWSLTTLEQPAVIETSLDKVLHAPERSDPEGFLLRLAKSLHTYGVPAYELEKSMQDCGTALGFGVQCMSIPTSITISIMHEHDVVSSYVIRTDPGEIDLEKLIQVTEIAQQVINKSMTPKEGALALREINESQPLYSLPVQTLALALVSFGITRVFGGSIYEMCAGAAFGAIVSFLIALSARFFTLRTVLPSVCAFSVVLASSLVNAYISPVASYAAIVSGLIILLPGMGLTIAMTELATQNLVSGTARFSGAMIVFLQLGLGLVVGSEVSNKLVDKVDIPLLPVLGEWTLWPALMVACIALMVPLNAHLKNAHWFVLAGLVAFGGSSFYTHYFDPALGTFFGAISVGICANAVRRYMGIPASIILLPGFLILVPGSVGFQSISAMVEQDVVKAAQIAMKTVMTGLSLVMGLLLSSLTAINFKNKS